MRRRVFDALVAVLLLTGCDSGLGNYCHGWSETQRPDGTWGESCPESTYCFDGRCVEMWFEECDPWDPFRDRPALNLEPNGRPELAVTLPCGDDGVESDPMEYAERCPAGVGAQLCLGHVDRHLRHGGDSRGQRVDRAVELVRLDSAVDHRPLGGARRVDVLAQHEQLPRARGADLVQQARGRTPGERDAEVDLGHAEDGVARGDPEVAGEREAAATTDRMAVDPRDRHDVAVADRRSRQAEPTCGIRGFFARSQGGPWVEWSKCSHTSLRSVALPRIGD